MTYYDVAIIGGGLAGLVAAATLERSKADFVVLEARERLGGRILTVDDRGNSDRGGFDLGPSWIWPQMQPAIAGLIEEFGLATVGQYTDGEALFERPGPAGNQTHRFPAEHMRGSMRLVGGTASLTRALASAIPSDRVRLGTRVSKITLTAPGTELEIVLKTSTSSLRARRVIAALPPRLLGASVAFAPAMDGLIRERWQGTATWMAPHAKFLAVYDDPFWRRAGLSGTAQSVIGPLSEIHDASADDGNAALFGFIGIDADRRQEVGDEQLKEACLRQFVRLFGEEASRPRATFIKDWANEPLTATMSDRAPSEHPEPYPGPWVSELWRNALTLAGSETGLVNPGYLSGAVTAGLAAAEAALAHGKVRPI